MPVNMLFVEGDLDKIIWGEIFAGNPLVDKRGGKDSLKPQAIQEIKLKKCHVQYLRDRDFDFDPPDSPGPQPIHWKKNPHEEITIGWYMQRHEIENYLIDPVIVEKAKPEWDINEYNAAICDAANAIRYYQAARWTLGVAKRSLPPNYEFRTRPVEIIDAELAIPVNAASLDTQKNWVTDTASEHLSKISGKLASAEVDGVFNSYLSKFDENFCGAVQDVIVWFAGKDILAAMKD